MDCTKCGNKMILRFASKGSKSGKHFWGCSNYPECNLTLDFLPEYPELFHQKYMGWVIFEKLKEFEGDNKANLLIDIKGQMLEILNHYVWCRVGECYSSIYRYLLIDYLDDSKVLDYFLKSDKIK